VSSQPAREARVIPLPRSHSTDAELVAAVAGGDQTALAQVWERYASDVRLSIRSSFGSDPLVDDLVQEVFIAFFRGAARLKNPRALRAYLLGTAMRVTAFEIRTRRRRFRWLLLSPSGVLPETEAPSEAEPRDALMALRLVLRQLRELPRMAFELRYVMELSPAQVAVALDISEAKARRAITEGRECVTALARGEPALAHYLRAETEEAP
jgi:RNA polymerase sigma-70 factor (ECF subfamily)